MLPAAGAAQAQAQAMVQSQASEAAMVVPLMEMVEERMAVMAAKEKIG